MNSSENKIVVGKPGQGLPLFEWLLAKYILLPQAYRKTSAKKAQLFFVKESKKLIELANTVEDENLTKRCLIDRLRGLEDNSRYWSVSMTLEHLVIVGKGITDTIVELTNGGTDKPMQKIEDVKPSPDSNPTKVKEDFFMMSEEFVSKINIDDLEKYPGQTFDHPWFGPMTAKQWYILAGRHQAIHRQQIEAIISKLETN